MNPILSVRDLTVSYAGRHGRVQAVRGVSFDVGPDETLALIGESGSGKTTLSSALVRLLPRAATLSAGEITFRSDSGAEIHLTGLGKEALRRFRWQECAMVFQSAQSALNPVLTVRDHFADTYAAHRKTNGGHDRGSLDARAAECLRFVQLDPERVLRAFPHQLSGGMRQRVLIALGLLLRPRLLILDEPATALDVITQRAIIEVIRRLKQELDFAMIMVSHDLSLAAELADRAATMYAGRIVELGDVDDLFYRPRHPYTVGLLRAVPTLAGGRENLSSVPGTPPDLVDLPPGCPFHPRCPFATARCRAEEPPLLDVGTGHTAACWHWEAVGAAWDQSTKAEPA